MDDENDASQASVGCLSQLSFNSQGFGDESSKNTSKSPTHVKLRKNMWLTQYIKYKRCGSDTKAYCLGCGQKLANRGHKRILSHLSSCSKSNYQSDMPVIVDDPQTTESITNELYLKALIDGNWSLNSTESPHVRKFFARLNSRWTIPSRRDMSALYIPRESQKCYKKFIDSLAHITTTISIEFDHWKDANNRSFLGVLATGDDGKRFILDLKDVSLRGHGAPVIVEELVNSLKDVPLKSINSIVSDNASACVKAREDIVKLRGFKHVMQHRCLAHFINLIGSRITNKKDSFGQVVEQASRVVAIISSSPYWTTYLNERDYRRPKTVCQVRWYSMATMLNALSTLKHVIVEEIAPKLDRDRARLMLGLDWQRVSELQTVVTPIAACIGEIEKEDTSFGEGMHHILEYAKLLFASEAECFSRDSNYEGLTLAKIAARKAFLHYFSEKKFGRAELGLCLAAYALDRRYKLNYLTPDGIELVMETIGYLAVRSGATLDQVLATIKLEFEYYKNYRSEYKMTSRKPIEWWSGKSFCGILSRVGLRLARLKASSANIERTFSSVKFIQGDHRLRLSGSSLLHLARLKISLKNETSTERVDPSEEWEDELDLWQQDEDPSPDDSIQSESCSNYGALPASSASWLENQDPVVKRDYQFFFKFIDFSICHEDPNSLGDVSQEISDEQIREELRSRLTSTQEGSQVVIVDDVIQMQETDAMMLETQ